MLDEGEVSAMIEGAPAILEKTGARVESRTILHKLGDNGANAGVAAQVVRLSSALLAVDEVFTPEKLLLDAEALSWLQRLTRRIDVNPGALALDSIHEVG